MNRQDEIHYFVESLLITADPQFSGSEQWHSFNENEPKGWNITENGHLVTVNDFVQYIGH